MKITHVRQSGMHRPPCEAAVRLAEGLCLDGEKTHTRQRREATMRRRGLPPGQCGVRSAFVVDGVNMCANHAGQLAVAYLLDRE